MAPPVSQYNHQRDTPMSAPDGPQEHDRQLAGREHGRDYGFAHDQQRPFNAAAHFNAVCSWLTILGIDAPSPQPHSHSY